MCTILSINFLSQNNSKQRQNSEKPKEFQFLILKRQNIFFAQNNFKKPQNSEKPKDFQL